jgi:two-component sensor histidine kinase
MGQGIPEGAEGAPNAGAPASAHAPSVLNQGLKIALHNTSVSVFYQDRDLTCVWAENAPNGRIGQALREGNSAELLSPSDSERLRASRQAALDGAVPGRIELRVPDPAGARWFQLWIDADEVQGEIRGVVTTAVEITEQKHREDALRMLLREVSHRSKNLLAIIQSIANQTGRYSGTVGDFLQRFRGRLQSLAASQDLVTSSNWRGADLHELIAGQVVRFCPDPVRNLRLEGRNPYLTPNAALHLGLALHELAVNAVSHGALSRADGLVTISAHAVRSEDSGDDSLELVWCERTNEPLPDLAEGRRFGSLALERVVPAALDGSARLAIEEGELTYRLTIPPGNFEVY